jgi:hypothetical protein
VRSREEHRNIKTRIFKKKTNHIAEKLVYQKTSFVIIKPNSTKKRKKMVEKELTRRKQTNILTAILILGVVLTACTPEGQAQEMRLDVNQSTNELNSTLTPTPTLTAKEEMRSKYDLDIVGHTGHLDYENPYHPVFNEETFGFKPNDLDPRETIIIDQNFTVPAGETVLFEDVIVYVIPKSRGDINVYGNLIIRNSLIIWMQSEVQQTRLRVSDGGVLDIKNSFCYSGNNYWFNWDYDDGSTIKFDNFNGHPWGSIHQSNVTYSAINFSTAYLTLGSGIRNVNVFISDSHDVYFEIGLSHGNHRLKLPDTSKWTDWIIDDLYPDSIIEVRDSYIFQRDIDLENDAHVTIYDTPDAFNIGWTISNWDSGHKNCELVGLGEPGNDEGIYYEFQVWELPCNNSSLTLQNSRLRAAWPIPAGYLDLVIRDSYLGDPKNWGAARVSIYDSELDAIFAVQGGLIYLENCMVNLIIDVSGPGSIIYVYQVSGSYEVFERLEGRFIELDEPGPPW